MIQAMTKMDIAEVLVQHLPHGAYDLSHQTFIYKDVLSHAAALEKVLESASDIVSVINGIPDNLIDEFEREYGLPLLCGQNNIGDSNADRKAEIERVKKDGHVILNLEGLYKLFALYDQSILDIETYRPMQCIGQCTDPLYTERLRFKVTLTLDKPIKTDMACLSKHYLPAALRLDIK